MPPPRPVVPALRVGLALWLAAVAWVTLRPAPADEGTFDAVRAVIARLAGLGLPVTYDGVEKAANVVMFVPGGLLLAALLHLRGRGSAARRVLTVTAAGLALSSGVELAQAAFLPSRVPTVVDVVMNTTGAALGALAALPAVPLVERLVAGRTAGREPSTRR